MCSVARNNVYCWRRVIKLYGAGRFFSCRHCYRLAYASQRESARHRGLWKSQKIRMLLGGSPNMLEEFPDKPKGMHWRIYERWCRVHDVAEKRGLRGFVKQLDLIQHRLKGVLDVRSEARPKTRPDGKRTGWTTPASETEAASSLSPGSRE